MALVLLFATTLLGQPAGTKAPQTQQIARRVSQMIEGNHISRAPIDDKISARFLDTFIKQMDAQKLYFLQADIDQFKGLKTQLDDLVKSGNTEFAANSWKLFIQRLDERMAVAHKWIDAQHDFTVDEAMAVDPKETAYAVNVAELDERWRKRVKFDLLALKLDKTADDEARKRLHRRYKTIRESFAQTEPDEVVEMYLTSLCEAFDPHSSYMSPRTLDDFRIQMELKLDGIGAALRGEDGYTVVQSIVPGGAAAADGRLKPGDKITAVSNDKGEMVDVIEMKLTKVVDYIRGKRGTKVKLQVVKGEGGAGELIELVRQTVPLTASEVKGEIIPAGDRVKGAAGRIGVIRIPSFYRDFRGAENGVEDFKSTSRDVKKVIDEFNSKGGVDLILIDLRTNGGGALTEAIEVSGLFIDEGPVVQVKNSRDKVSQLNDEEPGTSWNKPLVVVTNRLSASASEIFAGVIKDYRRGIIVGDRTTHGKGTVQSVMNVGKSAFDFLNPGPEQGALKLTIQQFYRVNGDSTQNLGVPSDVTLPSLLDNMDLGESYLDNAMPFDRVAAAAMTPYKAVAPEIVSALRDRSRKRVAEQPEFQKIETEIAKFLDRKARKSVSLNEAELMKERSDEENKVKEKIEAEEAGEGPVFADNPYNTELLSVALDYLSLLRETATAKK